MASGVLLLIVEEVVLALFTICLMYRYADIKSLNKIIFLCVTLAWFLSVNVILLLPLDVSVTLYEQCVSSIAKQAIIEKKVEHVNTVTNPYTRQVDTINLDSMTGISPKSMNTSSNISTSHVLTSTSCGMPWNYVNIKGIYLLWRIVYWGSLVLSWIILPFLQSYNNSGHFTTGGRLRTALINNAIYYATLILIFILLLMYFITSPNFKSISIYNLKSIVSATVNTWGTIFLVLLSGYGLIALPREWYEGRDIRRTYFQLSNLNDEKSLNISQLKEIIEDLTTFSKRVSPQHPVLRWRLDEIIKKMPISVQNDINQLTRTQHGSLGRSDTKGPDVTPNDLVRIHRRVIKSLQTKSRVNALWLKSLKEALLYEDIQLNIEYSSNLKIWRPKFSGCRFTNHPKIDYYWYCKLRGFAYMTTFYILCVASFSIIWSECTFFIQEFPVSIFALWVDLLDKLHAYLYLEILTTFIVAYIATCTYYTLFSIKFFNIFYIAPNQLTDANSLMFLGIMLCRLTASISLNVLGMIHLDKHVYKKQEHNIETQFTKLMGHLDILEPIKKQFYMYFPCLIFLITFSTYKKFGTKCINFIGIFQFLETSENSTKDNFTNDIIAMGKALVQMEKSKISEDPGIDSRHNSNGDRISSDGSVNFSDRWRSKFEKFSISGKNNNTKYTRLENNFEINPSSNLLESNPNRDQLLSTSKNSNLKNSSGNSHNLMMSNFSNSSSRTHSPSGTRANSGLGGAIGNGRLFDDV